MFSGDERGGKLKRVGCAQRVDADKARRRFTNNVARIDLLPTNFKFLQTTERFYQDSVIGSALAFASRQGGHAFDASTPPDEHAGII